MNDQTEKDLEFFRKMVSKDPNIKVKEAMPVLHRLLSKALGSFNWVLATNSGLDESKGNVIAKGAASSLENLAIDAAKKITSDSNVSSINFLANIIKRMDGLEIFWLLLKDQEEDNSGVCTNLERREEIEMLAAALKARADGVESVTVEVHKIGSS